MHGYCKPLEGSLSVLEIGSLAINPAFSSTEYNYILELPYRADDPGPWAVTLTTEEGYTAKIYIEDEELEGFLDPEGIWAYEGEGEFRYVTLKVETKKDGSEAVYETYYVKVYVSKLIENIEVEGETLVPLYDKEIFDYDIDGITAINLSNLKVEVDDSTYLEIHLNEMRDYSLDNNTNLPLFNGLNRLIISQNGLPYNISLNNTISTELHTVSFATKPHPSEAGKMQVEIGTSIVDTYFAGSWWYVVVSEDAINVSLDDPVGESITSTVYKGNKEDLEAMSIEASSGALVHLICGVHLDNNDQVIKIHETAMANPKE